MSKPADAILGRISNPELSLSDAPGGAMDKPARQLPDDELIGLVAHLDYLPRGEPDPTLRQRYNSTVAFLRREVSRREASNAEQDVQDLSSEARRTGKETCRCGSLHEPGSNYYVSAIDGKKKALLSGPYPTHAECLAVLPAIRDKLLLEDPASQFYSIGTVAMSHDYRRKGILDLPSQPTQPVTHKKLWQLGRKYAQLAAPEIARQAKLAGGPQLPIRGTTDLLPVLRDVYDLLEREHGIPWDNLTTAKQDDFLTGWWNMLKQEGVYETARS